MEIGLLLCFFLATAFAASPPLIKIGNTYYTPLVREEPRPAASLQNLQFTFPDFKEASGGYDYSPQSIDSGSGGYGYPASSGGYDYSTTTTPKPRGYLYPKPKQGYSYPRPKPIAETTTTEAQPAPVTEYPEKVNPDIDFELNKTPSAIGLETTEDNESVGLEPTPFPTPVHDKPDFEINYAPCNLPDTEHSWPCGLANSIPGKAGVDYPIYSSVPKTSFRCGDYSGYFGDMESRCQSFHVCLTRQDRPTQRYSFLCPNGTIFNQRDFVCTWWTEFRCSDTPSLYKLNQDLDWDNIDMTKGGTAALLKMMPYVNKPLPPAVAARPIVTLYNNEHSISQEVSKSNRKLSDAFLQSPSSDVISRTRTEVKKQRSESEAYEDKYDAEGFIVNRAPLSRPPVKVENPSGISIPNDPFEEELQQIDPETPLPFTTTTAAPTRGITYLPPRSPKPTYLPPAAESSEEPNDHPIDQDALPPDTQPERDFVPPTQVAPTYSPPQKPEPTYLPPTPRPTYLPPRTTTLPPLIETTTEQEEFFSPDSNVPPTFPERDYETNSKPKLMYLPPGNTSFAFRSKNNKAINDILSSSNIVDHLQDGEGFSGFSSQANQGQMAIFLPQKQTTKARSQAQQYANIRSPPQQTLNYANLVPPAPPSYEAVAPLQQQNYAPIRQETYQAPQSNSFPHPPQNYATQQENYAPIRQDVYQSPPTNSLPPPPPIPKSLGLGDISNLEQFRSVEITLPPFTRTFQPQVTNPQQVPLYQFRQPVVQYNSPPLQQVLVPAPQPVYYQPQPQVFYQPVYQNPQPRPVYNDLVPQTSLHSSIQVKSSDIPESVIKAITLHSSSIIGKDTNTPSTNYGAPSPSAEPSPTYFAPPVSTPSKPNYVTLKEYPKPTPRPIYEVPKFQQTTSWNVPSVPTVPTFYESPKPTSTISTQSSGGYSLPPIPPIPSFKSHKDPSVPTTPTFYDIPKESEIPQTGSGYSFVPIPPVPSYKPSQSSTFHKSINTHASSYISVPKPSPHNPYYSAPSSSEDEEPQQPQVIYEKPTYSYSSLSHSPNNFNKYKNSYIKSSSPARKPASLLLPAAKGTRFHSHYTKSKSVRFRGWY